MECEDPLALRHRPQWQWPKCVNGPRTSNETALQRQLPVNTSSDMFTLTDLVAAFRACTLPKEEWTHLAHLRVGAWHVHHHGGAEALALLRSGIRRLNDAHGTPNSTDSGYHETITVAYVRLIEERFAGLDAGLSLERRVELLTNGLLAERSVLFRFWSRDLLMSARARAEWVPPDLAPLAAPVDPA